MEVGEDLGRKIAASEGLEQPFPRLVGLDSVTLQHSALLLTDPYLLSLSEGPWKIRVSEPLSRKIPSKYMEL